MPTTSNLLNQYRSLDQYTQILVNEFSKPLFENKYYNYIDFLKLNSDTVIFNMEKWNINPLQFCQDHYGNQYYYLIVNMVNNINSFFEFTKDKFQNGIIAPKTDYIIKVTLL
jgi:hypothetical protein